MTGDELLEQLNNLIECARASLPHWVPTILEETVVEIRAVLKEAARARVVDRSQHPDEPRADSESD